MDAFDVFDPSRGEFKVKTKGVYVFSFSGQSYDNTVGGVSMYINGVCTLNYHQFFHSSTVQINFWESQLLDVGDAITFQNAVSNSIYVDIRRPMALVVYKIK